MSRTDAKEPLSSKSDVLIGAISSLQSPRTSTCQVRARPILAHDSLLTSRIAFDHEPRPATTISVITPATFFDKDLTASKCTSLRSSFLLADNESVTPTTQQPNSPTASPTSPVDHSGKIASQTSSDHVSTCSQASEETQARIRARPPTPQRPPAFQRPPPYPAPIQPHISRHLRHVRPRPRHPIRRRP